MGNPYAPPGSAPARGAAAPGTEPESDPDAGGRGDSPGSTAGGPAAGPDTRGGGGPGGGGPGFGGHPFGVGAPPTGGAPPEAPRGPGAPTRIPPSPEEARAAMRRLLHFGLLVLATLLLATMPFPWQIVALVAAMVTIAVGVRTLVRMWRSRSRGAVVPSIVVGLALTSLMAMQSVLALVTWDIEARYRTCIDGAITVSAKDRCDVERQTALEDWVENRLPGTQVTPGRD